MGMEERERDSSSAAWTWRRMETKAEDKRSVASGERRGAHRLFCCLCRLVSVSFFSFLFFSFLFFFLVVWA